MQKKLSCYAPDKSTEYRKNFQGSKWTEQHILHLTGNVYCKIFILDKCIGKSSGSVREDCELRLDQY